MEMLAVVYTFGEAGYCASLFSDTDSSACDEMEYCIYTGGASGSCDLIPNFETAWLGGDCEAVSSSNTTVAAGLTGMLSTLGYMSFEEMQGTLVGGGGGGTTPPPPPHTTRAALAAACRYGDSASPDLSSPATLVVVRLNVTDSPEGTSVTHVGTSVTEDVADCHYVSQNRTAALAGWTCGVAADPGAYAVTGLLVRDASRSGAPAPRAPLTGPEPLQRRDFEGECECPLCYERFGFVDVLGVSDSAARDAALAAA
jgi:hypothetical protein